MKASKVIAQKQLSLLNNLTTPNLTLKTNLNFAELDHEKRNNSEDLPEA